MPIENAATKGGRIEPEALNETNKLELYVFASEKHRQAVLVARLDNLGKGASGAAVQNMRLMLGLAGKSLIEYCWEANRWPERPCSSISARHCPEAAEERRIDDKEKHRHDLRP